MSRGRYQVPETPGYSIEMRPESLEENAFPGGTVWGRPGPTPSVVVCRGASSGDPGETAWAVKMGRRLWPVRGRAGMQYVPKLEVGPGFVANEGLCVHSVPKL